MRGAKRHCCPATADSEVVAGSVSVGSAHNDVFGPQSKHACDDLRKRLHHGPRANLNPRRDKRRAPVSVEMDGRRGGTDEDEPCADRRGAAVETVTRLAAFGRRRSFDLRHPVKHRSKDVALELLARGSQAPVAYNVASTEGDRIHANCVANLVGVPFQRESIVEPVAGPERTVGRRVRVDGAADEPNGPESIVATQRMGGHRRQENLLAAIRPAIHQHDRLAPDDLAGLRHSGADGNIGVLTTEAGLHLLAP